MWSAATRAWYLPMWVNSARPLMSPIAYSHGTPGTRMWASTSIVLPASSPTVSTPRPLGLRRAPERDEQHVALGVRAASVVLTVTVPSAS